MYDVRITKEALNGIKKLPPRLRMKLEEIFRNRVAVDPFSGKKLLGGLQGYYSIRLTYKDRIVYTVDEAQKTVFVHRARTHYGE